MKLIGNMGTESFEYFKLYIKACEENEEFECADERTVSETRLNLATIKLQPNIFSTDRDKLITPSYNDNAFYPLDPNYALSENILFMESIINVKD